MRYAVQGKDLSIAKHLRSKKARTGIADKQGNTPLHLTVQRNGNNDEAQDLAAAALKGCARRCVILAGDSDQSVYQPGFSFKQAGLDVVGKSRILRSNFRNSIPIHELAERYRALVPGLDKDNQPSAVRPGPPPELLQAKDRNALFDLLVARMGFFLGSFDYSPENIAVLVPMNDDIKFVIEGLRAAGVDAANIHPPAFDFASEGAVRVTDDSACNPCSRIMCNLCPRSIPSRRSLVPSRRSLVPSRRSLVPSRRSLVPSPVSLVPSRRSLVPSRRSLVPSRRFPRPFAPFPRPFAPFPGPFAPFPGPFARFPRPHLPDKARGQGRGALRGVPRKGRDQG